MDQKFEFDELYEVLQVLKNKKAPGCDRIPYEFYKYAPQSFLEKLLICFNHINDTCIVPDSFKQSFIFPILKRVVRIILAIIEASA